MSDTSRRKFLAVAGAGAAAGTVGIAVPASAAAVRKTNAADEPVVAFIENPDPACITPDVRRRRGRRQGPRPGRPDPQRRAGRQLTCRHTAKHRKSPRTRSPTAPTSTRSSARTSPDTVTLIANFIPLQQPDGGPNFYEFGDDVLYEIHISNRGDAKSDIVYQFEFRRRSATRRRSSTTPGRSPTSPARTGTGRSTTRSPASRRASARCSRKTLPLPAGQRGQAQHAELPGALRPGGAQAARRPEGVRRPAGRRVPRRPRQHLRPGRAAAAQRRAPDPDGDHGRRQLRPGLQRAHDRASRCRSAT